MGVLPAELDRRRHCDECVLALYGIGRQRLRPRHGDHLRRRHRPAPSRTRGAPATTTTTRHLQREAHRERAATAGSSGARSPAVFRRRRSARTRECARLRRAPRRARRDGWCDTTADCARAAPASTAPAPRRLRTARRPTTSAGHLHQNNDCNGDYCVERHLLGDRRHLHHGRELPGPSPATATCNTGVCACTTNNDCSGGAACMTRRLRHDRHPEPVPLKMENKGKPMTSTKILATSLLALLVAACYDRRPPAAGRPVRRQQRPDRRRGDRARRPHPACSSRCR